MKRRLSNERGQAIVEFVIVLPLLFALVLLIAYAGIAFVRYLNVTDAAQVGVASSNRRPLLRRGPVRLPPRRRRPTP